MKKKLVTSLFIFAGSLNLFAGIQENSFECDSSSYIFTSSQTANYTKALNVDMINEEIITVKERFASSHINAIGFNPKDGFIYGWEYTEGNKYAYNDYNPHVVRIDKNFNVEKVNLTGVLPATRFYLGDVSKNGIFYLANRHAPTNSSLLQEIQRVDLNTKKVLKKITLKQQNIYSSDFAIHPKDDMIYTVNAMTNQLVRINPKDGKVTELGDVGIQKPYKRYDEQSGEQYMYYPAYSVYNYFDRDGNFYFQVNGNTIYKIGIKTPWNKKDKVKARASYFKTLTISNSGDGARCALASISKDIPKTPNITISDATVVEGDSGIKNIVFHINSDIDIPYVEGLKLSYTLSDGSAKVGEDYNPYQGAFFMHGKSYSLSLPIIKGDTKAEADEDFFIHFTASIKAETATFTNDTVKATIIDDDRPENGICYATTDNYQKLFIYDDLDEKDGLANPKKINLTQLINGEGGAFRALDGYMYVFTYSKTSDDMNLKKIDVESGEVTPVKEGLLAEDVDAVEFFYNEEEKEDVMYVTDKHKGKFYTIDTTSWIASSKNIVDKEGEKVKIGALAIDPYSGKMYGVRDAGGWSGKDDTNPILYLLDISGSRVIATKLATLPRVDAEGLAFANDGNLYLETETLGPQQNEHKIFRLDLQTYKLTKVANSGTKDLTPTDTHENKYVDIETLSCNAGLYQAPNLPIFTITQKDVTIKEGNNNLQDGTNGKDITITITAKKALTKDVKFTVSQKDGTAKNTVDYKTFANDSFVMSKGKKSITFSQHSVIADIKVENNEYFTCEFTPEVGKFKDEENTIKINIIDDDDNILDAYDTTSSFTSRVIKTHVVNAPFKLKIASIQPDNAKASSFEDMKNIQMKIVNSTSCTSNATGLNMGAAVPFSLTMHGQLSPSFKVAKAYKRARVQFVWEDAETGDKKASCSSDEFAVRPDKYAIVKPSAIRAGEGFNLIVEAIDADGQPVTNYIEHQSSYLLEIDETKASVGCPRGTYTKAQHDFHAGQSLVDLNYNDVGMLAFKVSEKHGSEFASVDSSDGSGDNRFISDGVDTITVDASQFAVNLSFTTLNSQSNYTYYSADPTIMGAKIKAMVMVKDALGNPLNNFTNNCYAKDITVSFDPLQTGVGTVDLQNPDTTPATPLAGGRYSYIVSSTSFIIGGIGNRELYLNFGRVTETPKLPVKMQLSNPSATISSLAGTVNPLDKTISFIYARAHGQDEQTGVGANFIATIDYEAYLPSSVNPADYSLTLQGKGKDDLRWSVLGSDVAFGYSFGTTPALKFSKASITASTPTTVSITSVNTPHTNIITYATQPYLSSLQETSGIKIKMLSPTNQWSGKGNTGKIFDDTASKEIKRRMEW